MGLEELKQLLSYPRDIFLVTHRNPDGDAIGSTLGLLRVLKNMGHTVRAVVPSECPETYSWMPDIREFLVSDLHTEDAMSAIQRAELGFLLDFNAWDRIDKTAEWIRSREGLKTVLIDHHIDPEPMTDHVYWDVTASSTAELVYRFLLDLGLRSHLDLHAAEYLYTGILTDTGSFSYNTSARLFRIAAELKEMGVDDIRIQEQVFQSLGEKTLRLLGHCLANRMEVFPEHHAALITLDKTDYVQFQIQRGDTEGIINYLLKIKGMRLAAMIMEQPTIIKISLRSKGEVNVQELARAHFNGGGHKNASGGGIYTSLSNMVRKFKDALPTIPNLHN